MNNWQTSTAPLPNGVRLTATSADVLQVEGIRALGFTGLLVSGGHHQAHHLAVAKGMQMPSDRSTPIEAQPHNSRKPLSVTRTVEPSCLITPSSKVRWLAKLATSSTINPIANPMFC